MYDVPFLPTVVPADDTVLEIESPSTKSYKTKTYPLHKKECITLVPEIDRR